MDGKMTDSVSVRPQKKAPKEFSQGAFGFLAGGQGFEPW